MKKLTILLLAGLLAASPMFAQGDREARYTKTRPVSVESYRAVRLSDRIQVSFTAGYERLSISPNQELVVTPLVVKGRDTMRLEPVVFMGNVYADKLSRKERLYDEREHLRSQRTEVLNRRDMREIRRGFEQGDTGRYTMDYTFSFAYQPWMDNSQLFLEYYTRGCGSQDRYISEMGPLYEPVTPRVLFLVPEVEQVKARHDAMTARVMFRVNRYDINPNIFDNANELKRIYEFTDNVLNNPDLEVTNLHLTGYASPEASWAYNDRLSKNRVAALKDHLIKRYKMDPAKVATDNVPEDWDSLSRWIASSDIAFRQQVLDIISTTTNPDQRDAKIKALDNGQTYNMLLREVYPQLRRVEYVIEYTVLPFTVEKGKEVMLTNPQHLSLLELYQIAETYPVDSPEYREVFAIAVRNFPNDPVANNNMAAIAIRQRDLIAAMTYAQKSVDNAQSMNNLGIIYALEGRYDEAAQTFRRAIEMGSTEAAFNLENLYSLR